MSQEDLSNDLVRGLQDLLVREAQAPKAALLQHVRPFEICLSLLFVNSTVRFHHQPFLVAVEVHEEPVNELLSARVKSADLISAEAAPKRFLGRRWQVAKLHCPNMLRRIDALAFDDAPRVRHD